MSDEYPPKIIHNVIDRRNDHIRSWEVDRLQVEKLTATDIGRTVIYRDYGRAEAGTLSSWRGDIVFARYSKGDTGAGANARDLVFGVRQLSIAEPMQKTSIRNEEDQDGG